MHEKHKSTLAFINKYIKEEGYEKSIKILYRTHTFKNLDSQFRAFIRGIDSETRDTKVGKLHIYFDTKQRRTWDCDNYASAIIYPAASMLEYEKDFQILEDLKCRAQKIFLITSQEKTFGGVDRLEKISHRVATLNYDED